LPSGPGKGEHGYRYELRTPDGDDAGTFESGFCNWRAGDEFRGAGNRRYRITAVIRLPLIEEFVDRPLYGCMEVVPLE
jgi:hypothetical protein